MNWLKIWRWLCGQVRFEAEGGAPGRLLTLAAHEGIALWDTKREGTLVAARCAARDYPLLRPLARRCGLRMRIREKSGAAFLLKRYHARPGLIAGVAIYAILLLFLSGRIWSIDLRGLTHADETALRALLAEQGVAVGSKKSGVDTTKVQLAALKELVDISWLSVNIDGCIAEIEIKEIGLDEKPTEPNAPSNLIAAKDGIVTEVTITSGEATVQVGDAVAEGGILASGITTINEQETLIRRSSGTVLAETTEKLQVAVPLTETLLLPEEGSYETLELHFFGLILPLSGRDVVEGTWRVEEYDRLLTAEGVSLPLGARARRYTPLTPQLVHRTEAEAAQLAEQLLKEQEETVLKEAELLSRELSIEIRDDTLFLCGSYRCLENIALEVPLRIAATP